mmetsp:Transcript_50813/g.127591  ORF Transcript_50813/g.127591 Transcript_50813/m.127591 type:complete len:128 (+) Transcript_50813:1-384(+)
MLSSQRTHSLLQTIEPCFGQALVYDVCLTSKGLCLEGVCALAAQLWAAAALLHSSPQQAGAAQAARAALSAGTCLAECDGPDGGLRWEPAAPAHPDLLCYCHAFPTVPLPALAEMEAQLDQPAEMSK